MQFVLPILMHLQRISRQQRDILGLFFMALGAYSVLRLVFLYWNLSQYQKTPWKDVAFAFISGIRFDLSAVSYLILPLFFLGLFPWAERIWCRLAWFVFLTLQLPFLLLNFADIEFINFVGRRFTKQSLYILGEAEGKIGAFFATYAFWMIFEILLFSAFFWLAWRWLRRVHGRAEILSLVPVPRRRNSTILLILSLIIFYVVTSRGGLQRKPLSFVDANVFMAPTMNNLVLNSTFTILKSLGKDPVIREKFFTDRDELLRNLNGAESAPSLLERRRPTEPQNVVILILESFSLEYMGKVNGVPGYTPFLDELASRPQSLFFKSAIANGRRSIEGVAAVMAGIPALMAEPFISSEFTANRFVGLGSLVGEQYHTSFFHGGHNGTMHFDTFMRSAGIKNYFGAVEFGDSSQDDGTWGIFDEPFFHFYAQKLTEFPQPFLSGFFSLTSHHPYRIPDSYKGKFPSGPLEILPAISYTDFSLKKFFAEAEKKPWYKNTLFIITADHTQKNYLPNYDNEISKWKVPIIFFHPTYSWPKIDTEQIVQHIDILPSVLDFLNLQVKEKIWLARSVFVPGERTATTFVDGRYMLIAKDYFLDWGLGQNIRMYSMRDVNQENPLLEPAARRQELINRLKASIQYFDEGMWDNRLYYPAVRK